MDTIRKVNANEWTLNGRLVYLKADGVTLSDGYQPVYVMTAEQAEQIKAQFAADQAAIAAKRRAVPARGVGYSGRGQRVQEGAEWTWGRR